MLTRGCMVARRGVECPCGELSHGNYPNVNHFRRNHKGNGDPLKISNGAAPFAMPTLPCVPLTPLATCTHICRHCKLGSKSVAGANSATALINAPARAGSMPASSTMHEWHMHLPPYTAGLLQVRVMFECDQSSSFSTMSPDCVVAVIRETTPLAVMSMCRAKSYAWRLIYCCGRSAPR